MCKPLDLDEMISATYQMEDSVMYKVVCHERQAEKKDSSKSSAKSYSSGKSSSGWTFKPQQPKQSETGGQRPQLRLTEAKIAEKRDWDYVSRVMKNGQDNTGAPTVHYRC